MGSCCHGSRTISTHGTEIFRSRHSFIKFWPRVHRVSFDPPSDALQSYAWHKDVVRQQGVCLKRKLFKVDAMDEDSFGLSSFSDWGDSDRNIEDTFSSSEGEDSDNDLVLQPIPDLDLPISKDRFHITDDSVTMAAHRFRMLHRAQRKRKSKYGILNNVGLIMFVSFMFLLVDSCAWRIVRLPLAPFYLLRPFAISTAIACLLGYICVPFLRILKVQSVVRTKGSGQYSYKRGTPTMGGIYFIPTGIIVAEVLVGLSSTEVLGASAITLAFAVIGLIDDLMSLNNNNYELPLWMRILLEVAVTAGFLFWYCTTKISSPYGMKMLVPLPAPLGLVCLGHCYLILTMFCFVSLTNGVDLTDGLDGLAGGIAALAFTGMSIAVLPICSDLAVFGASMAGACVGFLFHNQYKASIFMGDTGSLALGGALAAMAALTGMFFPLFLACGIVVADTLSLMLQIKFFKSPKRLRGTGRQLFPFHHILELCGMKEPVIVGGAYLISSILVLFAGYVGLISA